MKKNPIKRFQNSLKRAEKKGLLLPNAMALATVSKDKTPSLRMMLLKNVDSRGFIFYTNLGSRKAKELSDNQNASITFWWPRLEEQVRVEGKIKAVSAKEADAYFATRPRESQISAWASRQSSRLTSRAKLLKRVKTFKKKFKGVPVPRPSFWSGFILSPKKVEFWKEMPDRLHKRELYTRKGKHWAFQLLYP